MHRLHLPFVVGVLLLYIFIHSVKNVTEVHVHVHVQYIQNQHFTLPILGENPTHTVHKYMYIHVHVHVRMYISYMY